PQRTKSNNAHACLGAPYGIYQSQNGYLALAMGVIPQLGTLLNCEKLLAFSDPAQAFDERDAIKSILAEHLLLATTEHWLSLLEPADIWCGDVLTWERLFLHDGFKAVNMFQEVSMGDGFSYFTTRCPIRIDGEPLTSTKGAPSLGEHNLTILEE